MESMFDRIEYLKHRGFSDGVVTMFKQLEEDVARRLFVDLMSLSDEQIFRFNYYEAAIRRSRA